MDGSALEHLFSIFQAASRWTMVRIEVYDDQLIGKGAFSNVYRGTWDSEPIAVKRLNKRDDRRYLQEAQALSQVSHDNIVGFFGILGNDSGTYDIMMEIIYGTSLAIALHRKQLRTMQQKCSTIDQISNGVAHLHERGILHLDLKPPNILFKDHSLERVVITDFGMAKIAVQSRRAGAYKFRAPDFPFTQQSDIFSLATIACCVLHERNPGSREEATEIVSNVLSQRYLHINPVWLEALRRGVDSNFAVRPTASQFRDVFCLSRPVPPYVAGELPPQKALTSTDSCSLTLDLGDTHGTNRRIDRLVGVGLLLLIIAALAATIYFLVSRFLHSKSS